jgi:hypothetical protein
LERIDINKSIVTDRRGNPNLPSRDLLVNADKGRTALRTTDGGDYRGGKDAKRGLQSSLWAPRRKAVSFLLPLDIDFGDDEDERDRVYSELNS